VPASGERRGPSTGRCRPRAGVLAAIVAAALASGLAVGAAPAGATRRAEPVAVAVVPPGADSVMPGIDARLLGVALLPGSGVDPSAELAAAQTELAGLQAEQRRLEDRDRELTIRFLQLTAVEQETQATLERTQALVDRVAAAAYKGASDELLAVLPSSNMLDLGRRMKLAGQAGTSLRAISERARRARRSAGRAAEAAAVESVRVRQRLGELARALPAAQRAVHARESEAASDLPARKIALSGIPVAAMDAYLRAATAMTLLAPTCGIEWWVLAGIADGESGHGTHGGARADVHGDVFPPIIGIPLDGTNHTQAVPDTDHGLVDTDPVWDRAVGVLQFIPATWNRWASDGNGDGTTDPQNLYDASLGAARKLCADAGPEGLHTDAQIARALKPYAVTAALVKAKLARAREYELQGIPAPDPAVARPAPS
jgi:membrane-bound lytic murein transglycosylase B